MSTPHRPKSSRHQRVKHAIALLLTTAAGFVDIVGYLSVFHLFTAHVTGTTVHLGSDIVKHDWHAVLIAAAIVASFFAASVIGRLLIEAAARLRFRRIASINLTIEAALLIWFILSGSSTPSLFSSAARLALLGAAMGLQTATLTRIGPLDVHTTFVTGMLNKLAQLVARILVRLREANTNPPVLRRTFHEALFVFSVWFLYLAGAAFGTWLESSWGLNALYIPVGLVALSILTDQVQPLSLEEEKDATAPNTLHK